MKKNILYGFCFAISFLSCSDKNIRSDEFFQNDDIKKSTMVDSAGFKLFWNKFRDAVINVDSPRIVGFVQKPLEVRGYEDADPIIRLYNNDSVINYFYKFLDERNVNYQELATHREFILKISDISVYDTTMVIDGTKTIENMMFRKNDSKWQLSRLYMNTKQLNNAQQ